ncbi:MAG: metallophosphoesterase [Planctomycetes bacterium]|nr:metallophosphoesterase [Planctomycetota bacterium]
MRFIAIGDIHEYVRNLPALRPHLSGTEAVVVTGDLTNYGGRDKARQILDALRSAHPRVLAQLGNLDQREVDGLLTSEGINLHGRGVRIGDVGFAGCGGSNPTPFSTPTEFTEAEIETILERAWSEIADAPLRVLVPHCPPKGTKVDRTAGGLHVGSTAVRSVIERRKPDLVLTGHIHEARGVDEVGGVPVINAGPLREGGFVEIVAESGTLRAELRQLERG